MKKVFAALLAISCPMFAAPWALASDGPAVYEDVGTQPDAPLEEDELFLSPSEPSDDIWAKSPPEEKCGLACALTKAVQESQEAAARGVSYASCPFHTILECEVWTTKPHVKENIALPARSIGRKNTDALRRAIDSGGPVDINAPYARPLIGRYKMLMKAARACCSAGMESKLKADGATPGLIYKYMSDDANFYGFNDRCLVMDDEELSARYPETAAANAVSDVRDACLCGRREWFGALLAPFDDFSDTDFVYSYQDGLKRDVNVSITDDVRRVQEALLRCL
jgi:hypothetical protein